MNKEQIEVMLSGIDDLYIEEAVNYKQSQLLRALPPAVRTALRSAAIIMVAIVAVSVTVIAASRILRKAFVEPDRIYVENDSYVQREEPDPEKRIPDFSLEDQILEDVDGDESVNWIHKKVEVLYGEYKNTYYLYDDYEKAIADHPMDRWFENHVGEVQTVGIVYQEDSDILENVTATVRLNYEGKEYNYSEEYYIHPIDNVHQFNVPLENPSNERTYEAKNKNVYTIIDDEDVMVEVLGKKSKVIVSYDNYYGVFTFYGFTDEEIHMVLDALTIE